jgi:hypothetical protein
MTRGVILFWSIAIALIALDSRYSPVAFRVEPPALAIGSGEISSSGHCSGR